MFGRCDFETRRREMVDVQIRARGVGDPAVLAAMRKVRREQFLPENLWEDSYEDRALCIEKGQTISQPYIVALMAAALELGPQDRVLEIGTGSGYAAAVLSEVAGEVYTIEWHERLAELARFRLERNGYDCVHLRNGDGGLGWPEEAPFDAISVAACGPQIPPMLKEQLTLGGRMVIPMGVTSRDQRLIRVLRKSQDHYVQKDLGKVRFVPLLGESGNHA